MRVTAARLALQLAPRYLALARRAYFATAPSVTVVLCLPPSAST